MQAVVGDGGETGKKMSHAEGTACESMYKDHAAGRSWMQYGCSF